MTPKTNCIYKIDSKILVYIFLSVPFIEPQLFKTGGFELFDRFFLVMKLVASCALFIDYCFQFNLKFSKYVVFMILSQVATLIGTVLIQGSVVRFMGPALISISMLMIVELANRVDLKSYLLGIQYYLELLLGLHYLTFIPRFLRIHPFADTTNTILGIENRWIYVMLPLTILAFLNSYIMHRRFTMHAYIIGFLSFFSIAYAWSAGAMVAFISFFTMLLCARKINKRVLNAKTMFLLFSVLNYLLVSEILLDSISFIIRDYLKKDITLSGRVYLWRTVFKLLQSNPLFGYGVHSSESDMRMFFLSSHGVNGTAVNHPHNHLMNVAFHGGWMALLFFLIIIIFVVFTIDKIEDRKLYAIFYAGMTAVFTAALVDTLDYSLFYMLISLPFLFFKRNANGILEPFHIYKILSGD